VVQRALAELAICVADTVQASPSDAELASEPGSRDCRTEADTPCGVG